MKCEEISDIIQNLNNQRNVRFILCKDIDPKYCAQYSGEMKLNNGEIIEVKISFYSHYPLSFPDFYVMNNQIFRVHVDSSGKICLLDKSSVLVKQNMPAQLLIDCFDKALGLLNILQGSKEYKNELYREFNSYWMMVKNERTYSLINTKTVQTGLYPIVESNHICIIADNKISAKVFLQNTLNLDTHKNTFEENCLVIKIRKGSPMIPIRKQYTWSEIRQFLSKNISSAANKQLKLFNGQKIDKGFFYIFLIYPTPQGEIFFGFRLEFKNSRKGSVKNSKCKISNVYVERVDYEYLLLRGGAAPLLKDKKVLLLGCGSVGGFIANNLCQSGILNLDILDQDLFKAENVHRHFLGFEAMGSNRKGYKADLVKAKLEASYPNLNIDSMSCEDRSAENFLADPTKLNQYDLIISALGEPTLNLEINRLLYQNGISVPFICCFNEPYGIGGHVIAVNLDNESCLQCLYSDIDSGEITTCRASLAEPGQYFKKNFSGCAGAFVPYSCLDSQQTAILAVRKAIDILEGKLRKNTLFTWFGDAQNFVAQGFSLSEMYQHHSDKGTFITDKIANPLCAICGNKGQI